MTPAALSETASKENTPGVRTVLGEARGSDRSRIHTIA